MKPLTDNLDRNAQHTGKLPRRVLAACSALVLVLGVAACGEQDQQSETMTGMAEKGVQEAKKTGQEAMQGAKKSADKAIKQVSPSATGAASTTGGPPSPEFQALDTNGDGQISSEEAKSNPKLSQNYDKLDSDGDGQLSKTEFSAFESGASKQKKASEKQPTGAQPRGDAGQSSSNVENPNRPAD